MKNKLRFIITALAAAGDAVTTIIAVNSKLAYEYNPIAKTFQDLVGLIPANIITAILFTVFVTSSYTISDLIKKKLYKNTVLYGTHFVLLVKILVVLNNILVISRF